MYPSIPLFLSCLMIQTNIQFKSEISLSTCTYVWWFKQTNRAHQKFLASHCTHTKLSFSLHLLLLNWNKQLVYMWKYSASILSMNWSNWFWNLKGRWRSEVMNISGDEWLREALNNIKEPSIWALGAVWTLARMVRGTYAVKIEVQMALSQIVLELKCPRVPIWFSVVLP